MASNHFPLILVVDDDPIILRTLSLNLQADGYDVLTAASGGEALLVVQQSLPDLAIVDLMLPDMHGFEVCKRLKQYLDLPIVMLTAVGTEESIVTGLEEYAEDYIVKPFSYRQLLARLGRVLKRARPAMPDSDVVRLDGDTAIDFARRQITAGGRAERLTPTESRALACLARNANQIVPTERLMDEVWPDGEGDAERLWVLINRLRHKLEPNPKEPRYLLNERGIGYSLAVGNP
ncbi:MAG: response regulator transcription factor [Chloroflexi bacterium]|nr:response regulator transcription factor [Chloroflexota bacterium]